VHGSAVAAAPFILFDAEARGKSEEVGRRWRQRGPMHFCRPAGSLARAPPRCFQNGLVVLLAFILRCVHPPSWCWQCLLFCHSTLTTIERAKQEERERERAGIWAGEVGRHQSIDKMADQSIDKMAEKQGRAKRRPIQEQPNNKNKIATSPAARAGCPKASSSTSEKDANLH